MYLSSFAPFGPDSFSTPDIRLKIQFTLNCGGSELLVDVVIGLIELSGVRFLFV